MLKMQQGANKRVKSYFQPNMTDNFSLSNIEVGQFVLLNGADLGVNVAPTDSLTLIHQVVFSESSTFGLVNIKGGIFKEIGSPTLMVEYLNENNARPLAKTELMLMVLNLDAKQFSCKNNG